MDYAQYNSAEARNEVQFAAQFMLLMRPYQDQQLQDWQWYSILAAYYTFVESHRYQSARTARTFYDDERARRLTTPATFRRSIFEVSQRGETRQLDLDDLAPIVTPARHNFHLNPYTPDIFVENMEPSRVEFSSELASDAALTRVVNRAVKEVSMGGRRTIVNAAKTDPGPNPTFQPVSNRSVVGWARVEGGGESCGFCAMLISRGPVFSGTGGFRNAGLNARNELDAISIWQQFDRTGDDTEILAMMNQWHPNCDCRVVPVFDEDAWPGKQRYEYLAQLWEDVTGGFASGKRRRTRSGRNTPDGGRKLIEFRKALGDGYKLPN